MPVSPQLLREVQRAIGNAHDLVMRRTALGLHRGNADAHADMRCGQRTLVRDRECGHFVEHRAGDLVATGTVRARQDRDHFLATVARHAVVCAGTRRAADRSRDGAQARVSCLVSVVVVVGLEVIDVEHHDRDNFAIADRLLPDAMDLALEGRAVQQSRESVVGRHFTQHAAFEEGDPVGVLERVAAGAGVEVRAQQQKDLVDRGLRRDVADECRNDEAGERQEVRAQRRLERQAEHEIEEKRREHEPRVDESRKRLGSVGGEQHRGEAVEWRKHVDERPVPAVAALRGQHDRGDDERQVHAKADRVGNAVRTGPEQPAVEDRKADDRGECQANADAHDASARVAVLGDELPLEFAWKPEPWKSRAQRAGDGRFSLFRHPCRGHLSADGLVALARGLHARAPHVERIPAAWRGRIGRAFLAWQFGDRRLVGGDKRSGSVSVSLERLDRFHRRRSSLMPGCLLLATDSNARYVTKALQIRCPHMSNQGFGAGSVS